MTSCIVIFGATGFIGRNLSMRLRGRFEHIIAVSPSGQAVGGATDSIAIRNLKDIRALPVETVVINVAAHRYDANRASLLHSDILRTNTEIVDLVYSFCMERNLKEVRAASSVAVYPSNMDIMDDRISIDLNKEPNSNESFYGWSKRWGEIVADLYNKKYGISTLSFRLSNPYGPFDSMDEKQAHVVPAFVIRALMSTGPFMIRGNSMVERDFIAVADVCDVFEKSLGIHGRHAAINLCRGQTSSLLELAQSILLLTNETREIISQTTGNDEIIARRSTNDTVRSWFNKDTFDDLITGLKPTIAWYKNALSNVRN